MGRTDNIQNTQLHKAVNRQVDWRAIEKAKRLGSASNKCSLVIKDVQ
jgi:hypothetical protein